MEVMLGVSKFKIMSVKLGIGFLVLAMATIVVARMWCPTASERATDWKRCDGSEPEGITVCLPVHRPSR